MHFDQERVFKSTHQLNLIAGMSNVTILDQLVLTLELHRILATLLLHLALILVRPLLLNFRRFLLHFYILLDIFEPVE
jgi:hypothetical protein